VKEATFVAASKIQALVDPKIVKPSATLVADDDGKVVQGTGMTVSVEIKKGSRRLPEYPLSPLVAHIAVHTPALIPLNSIA
jgi:hypothetical protein